MGHKYMLYGTKMFHVNKNGYILFHFVPILAKSNYLCAEKIHKES